MSDQDYQAALAHALVSLTPGVDSARIAGQGASQFLVLDKGDRCVEVIDPAIGQELQGEIIYESYSSAANAALYWLNGASRDELGPKGSD
jgi:hypothetical protein